MTELENLRLEQKRAHGDTPSDGVDGISHDAARSPPRGHPYRYLCAFSFQRTKCGFEDVPSNTKYLLTIDMIHASRRDPSGGVVSQVGWDRERRDAPELEGYIREAW